MRWKAEIERESHHYELKGKATVKMSKRSSRFGQGRGERRGARGSRQGHRDPQKTVKTTRRSDRGPHGQTDLGGARSPQRYPTKWGAVGRRARFNVSRYLQKSRASRRAASRPPPRRVQACARQRPLEEAAQRNRRTRCHRAEDRERIRGRAPGHLGPRVARAVGRRFFSPQTAAE